MRRMKQLVALVLILVFMVSTVSTPVAEVKAEDTLSLYREELAELNAELGTAYRFPSEEELAADGDVYADLVKYYTAMSQEEFRDYVYDAYQRESIADAAAYAKQRLCSEEQVSLRQTAAAEPFAYTGKQRYYYTIVNANNLYITCTRYTADGERYSSINSYGESHTTYPYYRPTGMKYSFSDGKKKVLCTFVCVKYSAKNLITEPNRLIQIRFSAGGGDLYAG